MKIKNISSKTLEIPFKRKSGQLKKVTLLPGQIMYCEENSDKNNQVIVYKRKKIIEVTNDEVPKNGEMYHSYGVLPHEEILKLKKETPEEKHQPIELELVEDEGVEVSIDEEIEKNLMSDIVIEPTITMDSEINSAPPKNKGGRPKGSTKKKKGRPKVKKPIGRPRKAPKPQKEEVENSELKSNDNNPNAAI